TTGGGAQVLSGMAAPSLVNPLVNQELPASVRYDIEKALVASDGVIEDATETVATAIGTAAAIGTAEEQAFANALITELGGTTDVNGTPLWQLKLGAAVTLA